MAYQFLSECKPPILIGKFDAGIFMKRARDHFNGMNTAKKESQRRDHEDRLSRYHNLLVSQFKVTLELAPKDDTDDDEENGTQGQVSLKHYFKLFYM